MTRTTLATAALALIVATASAQTNAPPTVSIAPIPNLVPPVATAVLSATVSDDGLPVGSSVSVRWCRQSGPGPVRFDDATSVNTLAEFDVAGIYELRLDATDGDLTTQQTVFVTVMPVSNLPVAVMSILSAAGPAQDPLFATRFLTLVDNAFPFNATGAQYYAEVDPLGQKTTLTDWQIANGFDGTEPLVATIEDGGTGCCSAGVFGNAGDLGFGRRMVMSRNADNDIAFYVVNYDTVDAAIIDDQSRIILTVCMEYSETPGASTSGKYIKYFMYDPAGNLITDVDFDGRGPKPVPLSCAVCHGGFYSPGGSIPADGNMGAQFLPFDLKTFEYSCEPGFTRVEQEAAFREFNSAILDTNAGIATRELIEGWYGGVGLPSPTQNPEFVPSGWVSEPELYRDVVAPSCRNCHLTRGGGSIDFDASTDFGNLASLINGPLVFGPSPSGFLMPHAERTFERFWLSTNPHQPAMLASAFSGSTFVGLGSPAGRIFVDADAAGANDGSSWTDAFTSFEDALAASTPGSGVTEIWAADGTYAPDATGLADPRTATFDIPNGVKIYGGFASGETLLEQRDITGNPTILSGDRGALDGLYHVVTCDNVASGTILDGFTILGGDADVPAEDAGGGMLVNNSSLDVVRVTIIENFGVRGAGVAVFGGSPRFLNCIVSGNRGGLEGAGFLVESGAQLVVDGCVLSNNDAMDADAEGGAIRVDGGTLSLRNSTLSRNYANLGDGGGVYLVNGATADIVNTILWRSCDLTGRTEAAQIFLDGSGAAPSASVNYSIIDGLTGGLGGVGNLGSDPLFIDDLGPDGIYGTTDDNLGLMFGSPCIDAGDATALALDDLDIDVDAVTFETVPVDAYHQARRVDSATTPDTGNGEAPLVDIGAIEYALPSLDDCAAGTVRRSVGGPEDVLFANGTAGGVNRQIFVGTGQALTIDMLPPTGQPFAQFALFLQIGLPDANDIVTLPFNIGSLCFTAAPFAPFASPTMNIVLTDNLFLLPAALPSFPAPWSLPIANIGTNELDFTMQGIIVDASKGIPFSTTNGIIVSVREDPPINLEPVAVPADPAFAVFTNETGVQLDGSASFDPEGEALTFQWMQTSGPAVTLNNATSAIADFDAPATAGALTFELTVNDGVTMSLPAAVMVTVQEDTPIAVATGPTSLFTNEVGMLDGTGSSDPNGQPITYCWTQTGGTSVTLSSKTSPTPTFTAPAASTTLVFELEVSDGTNTSLPDTVVIDVLTSFQNDVWPIFITTRLNCSGGNVVCMNCHDQPAPAGGLDFTVGASGVYNQLVPARVNLGTPSQSLILLKPLDPANGGANHGGGCIFNDTTDPDYITILNWIADGAPDDT